MQQLKHIIKKVSKKAFGYQDPRVAAQRAYLYFRKRIYTQKYSTQQLLDFIESLDIGSGDTIMMQSSWSEFYNFEGRAVEMLDGIIEIVGPSGNICMPCNSDYNDGDTFDVRKTPTIAGLLPEYFRRQKGVKRSIHYNSSVCALGPGADEIISDHNRSNTSWDEYSPYYKLWKMNAKNLNLGLGKLFICVTAIHCVDSILRKEIPFYKNLFGEPHTYNWLDENGEVGTQTVLKRERGIINFRRINRQITDIPHYSGRLSNLEGFSVSLQPLLERVLVLGRKGITIYNPY